MFHAFHVAYIGLFIGSFFEGETAILIAASLAARGKFGMTLPGVVIVSTLGALAGHIFFFWLGRTLGSSVVKRFPHLALHAERATAFFDRFGVASIFLAQYAYGLRIAFAIIIGLSRFTWRTFIVLEALSCLIWATLFTGLGAAFGAAMARTFEKYQWLEYVAIGVVLTATVAVFLFHWRKDTLLRKQHRLRTPPPTRHA